MNPSIPALGVVAAALIVYGISTGTVSTPSETKPTVEYVKLKYPAPGCYTRADMDKLLNIILAKDEVAEETMIRTRCPRMSVNLEFTVAERPFSDNICIRPVGMVDCRWTNKAWITETRRQ